MDPTIPGTEEGKDKVAPCPKCKTAEHVSVNPDYIGYNVYCENCYDVDCVGDPLQYVSSSHVSHGKTKADAIADWNEYVEDEEIVHTCSNECAWCNGNPNLK